MAKKLVAYFSASGVTEKLAKTIAQKAQADLFEIKPEKPYSSADLNYMNPLARCNKEKIGKKDVPIAQKINNINDYDTIYLGFPIWYWNAPAIIGTFLKEHNIKNTTIIPFATSGGSDLGKTSKTLQTFVDNSNTVKDGLLINGMNDNKIESLLNI